MTEITRLLQQIDEGDHAASAELLPLVYQELRSLAACWMDRESGGQTLQPTALVHEAYLRLVSTTDEVHWDSRGHFFAAAAESMRRILVESARQKRQLKRGGDRKQVPLEAALDGLSMPVDEFLDFDEALAELASHDDSAAQLVKLRFIAGLTMAECAQALDQPLRSTERLWRYARTWLFRKLQDPD